MEITSTMLGSSSTTSTLTFPLSFLFAFTHSLCESNLGVCWERQLGLRDPERVHKRGGVGSQQHAEVVDGLLHRFRRGRRELAVLLEPAAVVLDVGERVEAAQLVEDLLGRGIVAGL